MHENCEQGVSQSYNPKPLSNLLQHEKGGSPWQEEGVEKLMTW